MTQKKPRWKYYSDIDATLLERGHRELGRVEKGPKAFTRARIYKVFNPDAAAFYAYVGASHEDRRLVGRFGSMRSAKNAVAQALAVPKAA